MPGRLGTRKSSMPWPVNFRCEQNRKRLGRRNLASDTDALAEFWSRPASGCFSFHLAIQRREGTPSPMLRQSRERVAFHAAFAICFVETIGVPILKINR